MSTKPTTLPRWSTDLSNATEPSSGQKDTGWVPGQDGVSDYDNWKSYWAYKWCEWLNDGDVSFDEVTANTITTPALSATEVKSTGAVTFSGKVDYALTNNDTVLDPAGTGNTDTFHAVYLTHALSGVVTIHGLVAGVDGREIEIHNDGDNVLTETVYLKSNSGTASAGQQFRLPYNYDQVDDNGNSLRIPPRASVKLRYHAADGFWDVIRVTGCYIYRTFNIPASACVIVPSAPHTMSELGAITVNGAGAVGMPITLPSVSVIDKFAVYVKKNTDVTNTIVATLYTRQGNSDIESGLVSTPANSANAPGYVVLGPTGVGLASTTIADTGGAQWWIRYDSSGGTTPSADRLLCADVFAWVPV